MVTRKSKTSHKATGKVSTSTRSRYAGKTIRAASEARNMLRRIDQEDDPLLLHHSTRCSE